MVLMTDPNEPKILFKSTARFFAKFLTFRLNLLVASCNAMSMPRSYQQSAKQYSNIIKSPHIAYILNNSTETFIIGTSHFSSNSATEVRSLISTVNPDGVVLELDPERCLRLTKQSCGFDASGALQDVGEVVYGADFLAAIDTCQEMDIPLFLGDEYAEETRDRLMRRLGELNAYSPIPLIQSLIPDQEIHNKNTRINVIETFKRDPKKLTPLIVTTSPPFAVASAFSLFNSYYNPKIHEDTATMSDMFGTSVEIGFVVIASVLLSSLLFNNVIVERDRVLAQNTARAADVVKSLKCGKSIRKRWKFLASTQQLKETNPNQTFLSREHEASADNTKRKIVRDVPLFTLKTPIEKGMRRNLNLFEPRWLKMIDQLANSASSPKDLKLGCVQCSNKFYSAVSIDGSEGRYADIIFDTIGNLAEVVGVEEGVRPVSGDRRLSVALCGGDSFLVDESNLEVCKDGYMLASAVEPHCLEQVTSTLGQKQHMNEDEVVTIVVVAGLLHGNGVFSLLSGND